MMAPLPRSVTRRFNAELALGRPGYESRPFLDRAFWLNIDPSSEPWIEALVALDASAAGDKKPLNTEPLIKLLKSGQPPQEVCIYLADLLERYQLKRIRGGNRATPRYDLSKKNLEISAAIIEMRRLRARGLSYDDALQEAHKRYNVTMDQLTDAYRRGSVRRRKRKPRKRRTAESR